jgi:hypothetical protein
MRPQDLLILLKLIVWGKQTWKQGDVAQELFVSQTEISESLHRSSIAGLLAADRRHAKKEALLEFLSHGLRYVFPVAPGPLVRGLKTAQSAPPLSDTLAETSDIFVWPLDEGDTREHSPTAGIGPRSSGFLPVVPSLWR